MTVQEESTTALVPHGARHASARRTAVRPARRVGAASGIVFVAMQLALVAALAGAPALDAPTNEIRSYLVHDGGTVLAATTIGAVSVCFFLWFLGTLQTFLRAAEGGSGQLSRIAFGAGLVTITLAIGASLPTVALAWDDTAARAEPGLLHAIWNLNTLAFVPIGSSAGVFCLAAALVILRTRVLPVWGGWIGILAAVMSVIAVFFLLVDDPDSPLGTPANVGGFLLSNLFILLISVGMLFRSEPLAGNPELDGP
jgi:hypothetical protein